MDSWFEEVYCSQFLLSHHPHYENKKGSKNSWTRTSFFYDFKFFNSVLKCIITFKPKLEEQLFLLLLPFCPKKSTCNKIFKLANELPVRSISAEKIRIKNNQLLQTTDVYTCHFAQLSIVAFEKNFGTRPFSLLKKPNLNKVKYVEFFPKKPWKQLVERSPIKRVRFCRSHHMQSKCIIIEISLSASIKFDSRKGG